MSYKESLLRAAACGTLVEMQVSLAVARAIDKINEQTKAEGLIEGGVNTRNPEGITALMAASAAGNLENVRFLLAQGIDANASDNEGFTALMAASVRGQVYVVRLLAHYAEPNAVTHKNLAAIHLAVCHKQLRTLRALAAIPALNLNLPNERGRTALHSAAVEGFLPMVRFLMAHERVDAQAVDHQGFNVLHLAAGAHRLEVVTYLVSLGYDLNTKCSRLTTAMFIACAVGCLEVVEFLFDRTTLCADSDGDSELHVAVRHPHVLRYLLERRQHPLESVTKDGSTALHRAVHEDTGLMASVAALVAAKAPLDARDEFGCTPFFKACHHGDVKIVRFLLEAKSDPHVLDQDGFTAVHAAAQKGCVSVLKYLVLSVGLSREAQNPKGYTPLMCALRFSQTKACKWFVAQGVDLHVRSQIGTAVDVARLFEGSSVEAKQLSEWLAIPCGRQSCLERGSKKCGGCHKTRYCSTACQRLHWSEHEPTCFFSL